MKKKTSLEDLEKIGWKQTLETETKLILELKIKEHTWRCLWDKELNKVLMQIEYFENGDMTVIYPVRIITNKKNFCKDTANLEAGYKAEREQAKKERECRENWLKWIESKREQIRKEEEII